MNHIENNADRGSSNPRGGTRRVYTKLRITAGQRGGFGGQKIAEFPHRPNVSHHYHALHIAQFWKMIPFLGCNAT